MKKLVKWTVIAVLSLIALALAGTLAVRFGDNAERSDDFHAVCKYRHGQVKGDVCIKGDTVIMKKKEFR